MIKIALPRPRLFKFFNQTMLELKRVEWLSREKTFKYSMLVIAAIIISLVFLLGIDKALLELRNIIL